MYTAKGSPFAVIAFSLFLRKFGISEARTPYRKKGNGDKATVMDDRDGDGTPEEYPVLKGYIQNEKSYWALVDGKLVQYNSSKHTADQRVSPNYDLEAVRIYAEANCGVLLDELKITIGNVCSK